MRILIIEDEAGIVNFLRQGLTEEGFDVDVAGDGETGLQKALAGVYDLILVDWMLPKRNGLEIVNALRSANTRTPAIFLTAKDTVHDTVTGLRSGANDYLKKPFHFEELLERIRVQLRTHETGTMLQAGGITLYPDQHEVLNNGEPVQLTQKEFVLLEYLLRNKDKVCRRNRILEVVWGLDAEHDSGVIDVYINGIRKKLGQPSDGGLIQTIRGVGYIVKDK